MAKWSRSQKKWYVPDNVYYRQLFAMEAPIVGKAVLSKIHKVNLPPFRRFQEHLLLKRYSHNTVKTYSVEFAQLLYLLKDTLVDTLNEERLRSYFLYCHAKLKLSESEINSRINAIKFYFEKVLHRPKMFLDIPRPKKQKKLPKALSQKQVARLFKSTENIKHLCILELCYGMGLRVSEVVNIKIKDICTDTMQVRIEQGKGKKDRIVPLPHSVLPRQKSTIKLTLQRNIYLKGNMANNILFVQYKPYSRMLCKKQA